MLKRIYAIFKIARLGIKFLWQTYTRKKQFGTEIEPAATIGRVIVCVNCPSSQFNIEDWSCRYCECLVTLKARWSDEDCPFGHWPKLPNSAIEPADREDETNRSASP